MILNENLDAKLGMKLSDIFQINATIRVINVKYKELFQGILAKHEGVFEYELIDCKVQTHESMLIDLNNAQLTDNLKDVLYNIVRPYYPSKYIAIQELYSPNENAIAFSIGFHGPQDIREPFEIIVELSPKVSV